jgi:hypothetical protein
LGGNYVTVALENQPRVGTVIHSVVNKLSTRCGAFSFYLLVRRTRTSSSASLSSAIAKHGLMLRAFANSNLDEQSIFVVISTVEARAMNRTVRLQSDKQLAHGFDHPFRSGQVINRLVQIRHVFSYHCLVDAAVRAAPIVWH